MGGGPSAEDRRQSEFLRQQQAQQSAQQQQYMQQAAAPDPLAERWRAANLNFLDWEDSTGDFAGQPKDVTKAPGLGGFLDIYNRAAGEQEGERQGIGALRMGLNSSSPELAAKLAEQSKLRRQQGAAGELSNAYRARTAEAHGSVLPLIGYQADKGMGLASLSSGNMNAAGDRYTSFLSRPKPKPFWQTMLMGGMQAAGNVAAAGASAGAFA